MDTKTAPRESKQEDEDEHEGMIHLVDPDRPGYVLCGFKISGHLASDNDDPVDCVVCVELDRGR